MNLFLKNSLYRTISIARMLSSIGSYIYNLVFVIYATSLEERNIAVFIANIITILPTMFTFWAGIKADSTRRKAKMMITVGFVQAILFVVVAFLIVDKTFLVFSIICIINVVTDVLSDYSGGLRMPIIKRNLKDDEFFEAYSFMQFITYLCNIVGQTFGLWLLTVSNNNFSFVAIINALSFLLSSTILLMRRKKLTHDEVNEIFEKISLRVRIKNLYKTMELIFNKEENGSFIKVLLAILMINALGGSLTAIYNFYFLSNKIFNLSYGASLILVEAVMIVGMLVGSVTVNDYFSKKSLTTLISLNSLLFLLVGLVNLVKLTAICGILLLGFGAYILAKGMPKLDALLISNLSSDVLAQSNNFLSMLFTLSLPVGTFVFSSLALYNIFFCWLVFVVVAFCALILTIQNKRLSI